MFLKVLLMLGFAVVTGAVELWRDSNLQLADIPSDDRSFGESNMATVNNPAGGNEQVLRIFYPRNSYKPSASPRGGAGFFKTLSTPRTLVTLTFDIYFADNFDWVKGGKLPGLYGGSKTCSGGRSTTGCFSTRYMFRRQGDGEIYLYAPKEQRSGFCDDDKVKCNKNNKGHSVGRGTWRFTTGAWHTISQRVRLNDVGQKNGYVKVWYNGQQVLYFPNLNFRNSENVKIDGMFFSTFFGGADSSWATSENTYTYYRNFVLTT